MVSTARLYVALAVLGSAAPGSYARSSCRRASTVYSMTIKGTYLGYPYYQSLALHNLAPRSLEDSRQWGASSVFDTIQQQLPPFLYA